MSMIDLLRNLKMDIINALTILGHYMFYSKMLGAE